MPLLTILIIVGWLVYIQAKNQTGFDSVPATQNLLSNPDFEIWQNDTTPENWQITTASKIQKTDGFISGHGIRVESKLNQAAVIDSPLIETKSNQTYFFKVFYLTDTKVNLVAQLTHPDNTISYKLVNYFPDYDYHWSTMSGSITTDQTVKALRWRIVILDKGFVELDGAYAITTSNNDNIIRMPISSNLLQTQNVTLLTGDSNLQTELIDYNLTVKDYQSGQAELLLPKINVGAHELYRLDFAYQASTLSMLNIEVELNDGSYEYYFIDENQPADFWLQKSVEFETPAHAKSIAVLIQLKTNGSFSLKPNHAIYKLHDSAKFTEPLISIAFDDGWVSSYLNGASILEKYNLRGTFYVVPNLIGREAYMNEVQLGDLLTRGHHLGSHTFSHQDLSTINSTRISDELDKANQYLTQKFNLSQIDLASPYGKIDSVGLTLAKNKQRSHRGTRAGINTKQNFTSHNLRTLFIDKEKTTSELSRQLKLIKDYNGWLIVVYHQIEPNDSFFAIDPDVFEQQIDLISRSGIKVAPVNQVLDLLTNN